MVSLPLQYSSRQMLSTIQEESLSLHPFQDTPAEFLLSYSYVLKDGKLYSFIYCDKKCDYDFYHYGYHDTYVAIDLALHLVTNEIGHLATFDGTFLTFMHLEQLKAVFFLLHVYLIYS